MISSQSFNFNETICFAMLPSHHHSVIRHVGLW